MNTQITGRTARTGETENLWSLSKLPSHPHRAVVVEETATEKMTESEGGLAQEIVTTEDIGTTGVILTEGVREEDTLALVSAGDASADQMIVQETTLAEENVIEGMILARIEKIGRDMTGEAGLVATKKGARVL